MINQTIICPLFVMQSSHKRFYLNLNNYRNTHHLTLNKVKKEFSKQVTPQIRKLLGWKKVAVTFTLYPRTKGKVDTSNICSIQEKFLMDAVVRAGKLPDDDYTHHVKTTYLFGSVDKQNPRVEAKFIDMGGENDR